MVFALQKQHVMLEGKCLTQFICCLVRKNFCKVNRIIRVPCEFKMSEVPNINIGQMEALVHVKNGKDIHSNELVLIFLNKETSVAAKSLLSQPGVPGNAEDTSKPLREPRNDLCVWRAQGCHSREEIGFFLKNVSVGLTVC